MPVQVKSARPLGEFRIFEDIFNLDEHIRLAVVPLVRDRPTLMICKVGLLPKDDVATAAREEYGVYFLTRDAAGNDHASGFRTSYAYDKEELVEFSQGLYGSPLRPIEVVHCETQFRY